MPSAAAIALGIALLGGGTVGLAPDDATVDETPTPPPVEDPEPSESGGQSGLPGAAGIAAALAVLAAAGRREDEVSPAGGLGLRPGDPVVVFVPGHGQPHGSAAFDDLIEMMDVDAGSVRHFDYRWVEGSDDHSRASEAVGIDEAATALNAYLAGIAADGEQIYLVGFSKGGTTVAELLADWDDGQWGPSDRVVGAALLDPPMATGVHGWLQSVGRRVGWIPDDGGYDPVQCRFVTLWCDDRRAHLGEAAGVDVVVIRNPRAAITSFGDVPPGLRVYDAPDDGPGPFAQLLRNPFALPGRVSQAHEAVLADPDVADCIVTEIRTPGSCGLTPTGAPPPLPSLRPPAFRPPTAMKVL